MRALSASTFVAVLGLLTPIDAAGQAVPPARETTTVRSYDGRTMSGEIIRLVVPERRSRPERTISMAALRLPTTAERPGPPTFFLMGGPGIPGSVMVAVPPYFTLFERLRSIADVIIVDQRGIGRSTPVLDCPFDGSLSDSVFLREGPLVAELRRQVASCADRWRREGADPTWYTTVESADDIEDLRRVLGVDRINILAFSYGTRLALAVLQRHEAHLGRIVLQGVNGPGLVLKRPVATERKLELLNRLLRGDTLWAGTDLLAVARAARGRLTATPTSVTISDRRSGQPRQVAVGRYGLDVVVNTNLDDRRLPALLVSVAAGDDRLLGRFVERLWNGLTQSTVGLMARAVNCAADRPRSRWALIARDARRSPFGSPLDNAVLTDDFCAAIGYRQPEVEFPTPLRSEVPALLLTGVLDATNPVENARAVGRGLPRAILLTIENAVHEALPIPAVQDVVVAFLSGEDVRGRTVIAPVPRFPTVEAALERDSSPR
jgi:pimeloyl-ACP methyl ester carboxylesterase